MPEPILIEALTRRLAETPPEFLAEPKLGAAGDIHVDAVLADTLAQLGYASWDRQLLTARFAPAAKGERNRLRTVLIACWLLADPAFAGCGESAWNWLGGGIDEAVRLVQAEWWVSDPERREELARLALAACKLLPTGETAAQANDRLAAISTVQRQSAVAAARAAEERSSKVREEMEKKRLQEAAAKTSRE